MTTVDKMAELDIKSPEQRRLLEALLKTLDQCVPFGTIDLFEVLIALTSTVITTAANDRVCGEVMVTHTVERMNDAVESRWPDAPRKH